MTNQEIFTRVKEHLLAQNCKSRKEPAEFGAPSCFYRGPNGTKCAIGCLIPDELYSPSMEPKGVLHLLGEYDLPDLRGVDERLLIHLQNLHDTTPVLQWPHELEMAASYFNLEY